MPTACHAALRPHHHRGDRSTATRRPQQQQQLARAVEQACSAATPAAARVRQRVRRAGRIGSGVRGLTAQIGQAALVRPTCSGSSDAARDLVMRGVPSCCCGLLRERSVLPFLEPAFRDPPSGAWTATRCRCDARAVLAVPPSPSRAQCWRRRRRSSKHNATELALVRLTLLRERGRLERRSPAHSMPSSPSRCHQTPSTPRSGRSSSRTST